MTAPLFTQETFRLRNDDGNETTATWRQNEGVDDTINTGTNFRCRFNIDETNNKSWTSKTWDLYYSLEGGTYTAVSGSTPVQFSASANFTDSDDCTDQLSGGTGTFVTDNNGMKQTTGGATNSGTSGFLFELEWCLKIDAAQVADGNTIALRVYDGSTAINAYTDTPLITVNEVTAYSLAVDVGAYALTGVAAALKHTRVMGAALGTFALTGATASLAKGRVVSAALGTYALAGVAAGLSKTSKLSAAVGSYTQTGIAASLLWRHRFAADAGLYNLTGADVTLTYTTGANWVLSASDFITASGEDTTAQLTPPSGKSTADFQAGRIADDENPLDSIDLVTNKYTEIEWSIKPTGAAIGQTWEFRVTVAGTPFATYTNTPTITLISATVMTVDVGSYNLTGNAAGLAHGYRLSAEAGTYALTGNAAGLTAARKITADVGAYTYAGIAANLKKGWSLSASLGTYAITGVDVTLTEGGGLTHYSLAVNVGAYNLTGVTITTPWQHRLKPDVGAYNITGEAAGVLHGYAIGAAVGAYTLTGLAANLFYRHRLGALAGLYLLAGVDPGLTWSHLYSPTVPVIFPARSSIESDYNNCVPVERDTVTADADGQIKPARSAIQTTVYRR